MRTALVPEEERIVTPGPEAVRDLEGLPDATIMNWATLLNVNVVNPTSQDERYVALEMGKDVVHNRGHPWLATMMDAQSTLVSEGMYLPSIGLLVNGLLAILRSKHGAIAQDRLRSEEEAVYLSNTWLDRKSQPILSSVAPLCAQYADASGRILTAYSEPIQNIAKRDYTLQEAMLPQMIHDYQTDDLLRKLSGLKDPLKLRALGNGLGKRVFLGGEPLYAPEDTQVGLRVRKDSITLDAFIPANEKGLIWPVRLI